MLSIALFETGVYFFPGEIHDYSTDSKIAEACLFARDAKSLVAQEFHMNGVNGFQAAAAAWERKPLSEKQSKFIADVRINSSGVVTVVLAANKNNGLPEFIDGKTLKFSPNVQYAAPATLLWACAGATSASAKQSGLTNISLGTLEPRYAPPECR